jgi:23S rRNA U2552 (ribose-2'-O)-methylase RlmE/FtsJ
VLPLIKRRGPDYQIEDPVPLSREEKLAYETSQSRVTPPLFKVRRCVLIAISASGKTTAINKSSRTDLVDIDDHVKWPSFDDPPETYTSWLNSDFISVVTSMPDKVVCTHGDEEMIQVLIAAGIRFVVVGIDPSMYQRHLTARAARKGFLGTRLYYHLLNQSVLFYERADYHSFNDAFSCLTPLCRSAYKLDEMLPLIPSFDSVLDLGAAPGSWSQLITFRSNALITAVSPYNMSFSASRMTYESRSVRGYTPDRRYDLILSDIADDDDHLETQRCLLPSVIRIIDQGLSKKGASIIKLFASNKPVVVRLISRLQKLFKCSLIMIPTGTRLTSSECYFIGYRTKPPINWAGQTLSSVLRLRMDLTMVHRWSAIGADK